MTPQTPPNPNTLLTLPLELRDQIYAHAVRLTTPIPLYAHHASHLPPLLSTHAQLESEALRVYYAVNSFTLSLTPTAPSAAATAQTDENEPDYAHDWTAGRLSPLRPHITTLIVSADESFSPHDGPYSRIYEDTCAAPDRRRWSQLLLLPHLQNLTIKLQKKHQTTLFMRDFGPVVYRLREVQRRRFGRDMRVELKISFDDMLRAAFEDPVWTMLGAASTAESPSYVGMGYVDASALLEEASAADKQYVEDFLGLGEVVRMPPPPPPILGLLSEGVGNRRHLAVHYAVREPEVMRVVMGLWYKVFLEVEREKAGAESGELPG